MAMWAVTVVGAAALAAMPPTVTLAALIPAVVAALLVPAPTAALHRLVRPEKMRRSRRSKHDGR